MSCTSASRDTFRLVDAEVYRGRTSEKRVALYLNYTSRAGSGQARPAAAIEGLVAKPYRQLRSVHRKGLLLSCSARADGTPSRDNACTHGKRLQVRVRSARLNRPRAACKGARQPKPSEYALKASPPLCRVCLLAINALVTTKSQWNAKVVHGHHQDGRGPSYEKRDER